MIDKRNTAWQEQALCREVDPDSFFPDNEDGGMAAGSKELFTLAKRMCRGCDVRAECLAFALRREEDYRFGVWGGYGPTERRRLARELEDKTPDELRVWIAKNDNRRLA